MAGSAKDFSALAAYLPAGGYDPVMHYIRRYNVQLTITRTRKTILGDYRHPHGGKGHRISINGNLNPYSFLITLLHELAHLTTYEKYKNQVSPHGGEWQTEFAQILKGFIQNSIFPSDIVTALQKSVTGAAASSCADVNLLKALKNYDKKSKETVYIESIALGERFKIPGERVFTKGPKLRKRFKCQENTTGKYYLFSPVYEVTLLS